MRFLLWMAALGAALSARAQTNPNIPPSGPDVQTSPEASILSELHSANLAEIQEGKLAQDKGTLSQTKSFGKMLIKDHTAADEMVKKEASRLNITLSHTLPAAQQAEVDDLTASSDFDASFARDEAAGHAKVISDAESAERNTTDRGVKELITRLLPKLRKHEKDAERLEKKSTKTL